jgi:hypothetical protein
LRVSLNRSSLRPALGRLGPLITCAFVVIASEARADLAVRGAEMNRFGRIALEFDKANKVSARAANGVLVITFGAPTPIKAERLAAEMPTYVSNARRDPDRTGLRLALTDNYRVSVLEAGEKVFVDLLPENWTGLPPGLPPDVVSELARRAQETEARAEAEALRRQAEAARPIKVRVASLPTLTRIVFEPPGIVPVKFTAKGSEASLSFDSPLTLDRSQIAGQLAPAVRDLTVDESKDGLVVRLTLDTGFEARGFREDEAFVVDVSKPQGAAMTPVVPVSAPVLQAKPTAQASKPAQPQAAPARTEPPSKPAQEPLSTSKTAGPVRPNVGVTSDGLRVAFPFSGRAAAAAFERAGVLTVVFHTPEPIALAALPPEAEPYAKLRDVVREGAFAVVRFTLPKPQMARLTSQGQEWVLTLGEAHPAALQPLPVNRSVDEDGRALVTVPLTDSSGVHWIDDGRGGERLAVVTAHGVPRGTPKQHRFVEFSLLPTVQGVAVSAVADDIVVRSGMDGVTISRQSGLSVSLPAAIAEGGPKLAKTEPVFQREPWRRAQMGSVLDRWRDMLREAADAPPWQRSQKRIELARMLLANGLYPEAASVLAYAAEENRALKEQRPVLLLQAVAALRMGRLPEAKTFLSSGPLAEDPEGMLWRASLDATHKRWALALPAFQHAGPVLEFYPESLQAPLRLQAARAAIEMRDFVFADSELAAVGPLVSGGHNDEFMFLRARLDQALGRQDLALESYRHLAETAERPVAAQAILAFVDLALRNGAIAAPDAISRLEALSVVWRGDDVEVATLEQLGRLYAQAGRWREAFLMARRANEMFPDHEITRTLHNETARLFEDLFLSGKGDALSRVDSLALFFDFQEFTPIGRRGDEIVRRLADRLVSLDLLEQAGALLQHQVDNRLYGAARATVAARLATVRLMDNKPLLALQALRSTRLPELPQAVNRARLLLEARALSDLSRTDLALEILEGQKGGEIERLRADILWSGRRWREAGEVHEGLVGTRWQGQSVLEAQDRNDLMRAAIAYSLSDDALALDRLRGKFAPKMADSADARTFDFLTQPNVGSTRAFRDLARKVTSADTLSDFLSEYRKRYPEASAAERQRRPGLQEPDSKPQDSAGKPQARGAEAAPPNG